MKKNTCIYIYAHIHVCAFLLPALEQPTSQPMHASRPLLPFTQTSSNHFLFLVSFWFALDLKKKKCMYTLKKSFIYLFFGCTQPFSSCGEWGLLSSCGVRASHCGSFSCGAQAPGYAGFSSCGTWA